MHESESHYLLPTNNPLLLPKPMPTIFITKERLAKGFFELRYIRTAPIQPEAANINTLLPHDPSDLSSGRINKMWGLRRAGVGVDIAMKWVNGPYTALAVRWILLLQASLKGLVPIRVYLRHFNQVENKQWCAISCHQKKQENLNEGANVKSKPALNF